ncbi:hypothetical protein [Anaerobacillus alkaliphilus]|uniref:hypothetical protein n=1 Tax=Anaerobacillus alkaliphilus TaxID=1548597 RepID=UPI0013762220|nr:hypothetical protein [Anaerobacillus alkaliphilus]
MVHQKIRLAIFLIQFANRSGGYTLHGLFKHGDEFAWMNYPYLSVTPPSEFMLQMPLCV